jgi:chemotaxis protein MotB
VKRKRRVEEHENLERWLITYADLITLLLAFFIMMYTFSKQDAQKYQEVTSGLKTIFSGGSGVVKKGSVAAAGVPEGLSKEETRKQLESEFKGMGTEEKVPENVSVISDERGIVIRIMDKAFFDEGKADLKEGAKKALDRISPIIERLPNHLRVEGHTDNVPIRTAEFRSNWELSVRRATEVVRYLVDGKEFPPVRISAAGFAEHRPLAPNDKPENRARNRRIEIIIVAAGEVPQSIGR